MPKRCRTYPDPAHVRRTEEQGNPELAEALRQLAARGIGRQAAEGADAAFSETAWRELNEILPFGWDDLTNYYVKEGFIEPSPELQKALGSADMLYMPGKGDVEQVSLIAAVTKAKLQAEAGGIAEAADNFIRKIESGGDGLVDGLYFAQQLQGMSRFGTYVMGWDQQLGRGLRNQRWAVNKFDREGIEALEISAKEADRLTDLLGNPGEYMTKFQDIALKLRSPETKAEAVNDLLSMAKKIKFLEDPSKITRVALGLEVAGNAWQEVWMNGLLSSPATLVANASAVLNAAGRPVMQLLAAKAWQAMPGAPGKGAATQAAAEAVAQLTAMQMAWQDAFTLGWRAIRTERSVYGATITPAITGENFKTSYAAIAKKFGDIEPPDLLADLVDKVGAVTRLPSRAMLGTDDAIKHLTVRAEVASEAIKRMVKDGVDLQDAAETQKYIAREFDQAFHLTSPEKWKQWQLKSSYRPGNRVLRQAEEATFQEYNPFATKANKVLGFGGGILRPFFPFVKTPLNILKQGFIENTGLTAAGRLSRDVIDAGFNPIEIGRRVQKRLLEDPGESFRMAGTISFSYLMMGTIYQMGMNGQTVGGGPINWVTDKRSAMDAQRNWERYKNGAKYSFVLGDTVIPFDRFGEPLSLLLKVAADYADMSTYEPPESAAESLAALASMGAVAMYSSTFLTGVEDLVEIISNPNPNNNKIGRAAQNFTSTQTPFGGLLAFVDKQQNPYRREFGGATTEDILKGQVNMFNQGVLARLVERLPGVDPGQPEVIDPITGDPINVYGAAGPYGLNLAQAMIPVWPRGPAKGHEAWNVIWDVGAGYFPQPPDTIRMTPHEKHRFNRTMGTMKIGGLTLAERLVRFGNRADVREFRDRKGAFYEDAKDSEFRREMIAIISTYRNAARTRMEIESPLYRQRRLLKDQAIVQLKRNDTAGAQATEQQIQELLRQARVIETNDARAPRE